MPGQIQETVPRSATIWTPQGLTPCTLSGTLLTPNIAKCGLITSTLTTPGTVTNPGTILSNPVGLLSYNQAIMYFTLRFKQGGTGTNILGYGSAYNWIGGVHPTLSTRVGAIDEWTCHTDPEFPLSVTCAGALLDIKGGGPNPVPLVSNLAVNAGAGASLQVSLVGYSGHPIIAGVFWCDGGACGANAASVTSITTTSGNICTAVPNTRSTNERATQIWNCGIGAVGDNTLTVNCSGGGGCYYMIIAANEFSTITGNCEAGAFTQGASAANFSATTNGPSSRINEVIYSISNHDTATATPAQILLNTNVNNTADSYQIGKSPSTYSNSWTSGTSSFYSESIAACY